MLRRTVIAAVIGGAALAAATSAGAENWIAFFVVPGGVVFLDRDSVSHDRGHVGARLESTFPQPQQLSRNGRLFNYVKTIDLVDVDCRARVYRNISRDLYADDGLMALSINEADNPLRIPPGSVQAALTTAFCDRT